MASLAIYCLTLLIFLIDALTPLNIAIAVLYGAVILLAANVCGWSARSVILLGAGCLSLTMVAYSLGHRLDFFGPALGRCVVSLCAIAITTFLALKGQVTANALRKREEASRLADQQKDKFLAMLAHELRNPIAPISSAAYLLRASPPQHDLIQETTEVIIRQTEHLSGLVDDLLDVSRIKRGIAVLEKNEVNMGHVVSDAVEQVRPLIDSCGHQLTMQLPEHQVFALGDHKRLVQVISNVLSNSIRYTPDGGKITVRLNPVGQHIELEITDSGIGISAELLPHVFDLFTQAERSPDRQQGGLGIGLALVKNIVEMHGGSVEAFSKGHYTGSTFTIRLPLIGKKHAQPSRAIKEPVLTGSRALRILVVDDNPDVAKMLTKYLMAIGLHAIAVYGSKAALAMVERESFDVYLLDIGLPEIDGYDLVRMLRGMENARNALMIAITGYGQQYDRQKALDYGFDHYFVKPVNPALLVTLVNQWKPSGTKITTEIEN